jgi:DNA replication protein DnaC
MTYWQKKHLRLEVTHPIIQEAADHATNLAKWFATNERIFCKPVLVLCGESGCGKTHIAKHLYRWARTYSGRTGASIVYQSWAEACDLITEGYDGLVQDCMEADFLALDDVGAESDRYKTGIMVDKLCQILSRREERYTIITTNIGPAQWNSRFDIRVADRLVRNSEVCDMSSVPSYSIQKFLGGDNQKAA